MVVIICALKITTTW